MRNLFVFLFGFLFIPAVGFSQFKEYRICNSFDSTITRISIDTLGAWEIGQPTKTVMNGSYSGENSIVTGLDSLYSANDTSIFYFTYASDYDGYFPGEYLGYYTEFEMEFKHRFITDSISDFGGVEMSIDGGVSWVDVLSSDYNSFYNPVDPSPNAHFYEETEITVFDSLTVSGNSQGWIYSTFSKDLNQMVYDNPDWLDGSLIDSVIVRFSFVSDSSGGNEGWQIDDLCTSMDIIDNIDENEKDEKPLIYPNPNKGTFRIRESYDTDSVHIYNLYGKEVHSEMISKEEIFTNLPQGMYLVLIHKADGVCTERMIIE
jgi:hypothetical protein